MNENILKIIDSCLEISKKFDSLPVSNFISEEKELLSSAKTGKILFIGQQSENLTACLKAVLQADELEPLSLKYIDRAFRLNISYAEEFSCSTSEFGKDSRACELNKIAAAVSNFNKDIIPSVDITIKSEKLKSFGITLIHSYDGFKEFIWKKELSRTDFAFLFTNATCAMNMYEQAFLSEYLRNYLGSARTGIVLCGMQLLNTETDRQDVISSVNSILTSNGISGDLMYTDNAALEKFIYSYVSENIAELHNLRDIQVADMCIREIDDMLAEKEKEACLDVDAIKDLIEDMKKKKEDIVNRGYIAADNARANIKLSLAENFLTELENYNDEVFENIKKGIEKTDDVSKIKGKIPEFIQSAWEIFLREKSQWMDDTVNCIINKTYAEMEKDADEFFADAADDKKKLLEQLLEDKIDFLTPDIPFVYRKDFNGKTLPEAKTNKLTAASKVILLSSIPVVFILGPVQGIVTAVGGIALKKYNENKLKAESKEELIRAIENICITTKTELYNEYCTEIEDLSEKTADRICSSYEKFADVLINSLNRLYENASILSSQLDEIKDIRSNKIPKLKNTLML